MVGHPEGDDFEMAKVFVDILGVFYEITLKISAFTHPTVHITFQDVITMEKNIKSMYVSAELSTGAETRKILNEMAVNMKNRWFKYYGSFHELNHIVIIGLVLDARFKLKNVTYTFNQEGLGDEEVERRTKDLKNLLFALYNQLLGDDIAEVIDDCTIENYEFYKGVELEHESTTTTKANVSPPPPSRAKAKGKGNVASPIDV
ncbi:hypothetical protein ACLB2K_053865 [Fragaria x ananassa]